MSTRMTRSRSRQPSMESNAPSSTRPSSRPVSLRLKEPTNRYITMLPNNILRKTTSLSPDAYSLLQSKRHQLRLPTAQVPSFIEQCEMSNCDTSLSRLASSAAAALVFAQEEAGTAVCVSSSGLLLTCAHCVSESEVALDMSTSHWLLFADGSIVKAKCVAWDGTRDLALLQIVATQASLRTAKPVTLVPLQPDMTSEPPGRPFVEVSDTQPAMNAPVICIGHPGSEDLEGSKEGVRNNYDVLHVSEGRFRGLDKDQDPHDNSDIGALKHTAWTYWGHSGAPLIEKSTGKLIGLHSSWDDQTGTRRGIPLVAIRAFIDEHCIATVDLTEDED